MSILKNIPLKKYSNINIGGPSAYFIEFDSLDKLRIILKDWSKKYPKMDNVFVMGEGTNILFDDEGFSGLVLKNKIDYLVKHNDYIEVGGGVSVSALIEFYIQNNYSGLEWAGGLPGTIGGAIRGNAGAFGGETKDVVVEVTSFNFKKLKTITRSNAKCNFSYRNSIYKLKEGEDEIILSTKFKFKKGELNEIKKNTQEKIDYRIAKHPLDYPNVGSIFKNIPAKSAPKEVLTKFEKSIKNDPFPVIPTAKILASLDLKGKRVGGAMVSEKHPNYIINYDNAKGRDVKKLINEIKTEVKLKYNIDLEEEIMILPGTID